MQAVVPPERAAAATGSHWLAPYACHAQHTRGRRWPEKPAPTRSEYQRDRDRIIHSSAFRRLVYKTQVFLNHEGDLFRTRLTHSLEVAQLGRSIARTLGLNEDLVEAIALAHDLGHTPFGHAGQDALNACMAEQGGFEHNLQSLRVVDLLEQRYPQYDGINLTFETRAGILKHCSQANARKLEQAEPGGVAQRFILGTQPTLEAQLCNLADEIAYNSHDIDDGVRSGLITMEQLQDVELFATHLREVLAQHPQLAAQTHNRRLLYEVIRRILSVQVYSVIDASRQALQQAQPQSAQDVAEAGRNLIVFGDDMRRQLQQLKQFLMRNLYRHPRVMGEMERAQQIIRDLFASYMHDPAQMSQRGTPPQMPQPAQRARFVADYLAGMTDRFAMREHERITGQRVFDTD